MTRDDEVNLELLRNELSRCHAELAELREQLQRERQALGWAKKTIAEILAAGKPGTTHAARQSETTLAAPITPCS